MAMTRVVGDDLRVGTMVELVASPPERTFVGGSLEDEAASRIITA
ncbi:hypothetical protein [Streptomyces capillispiralis]|uniref:Uncharacterized protein n=1 Tax=Streptomyces capillispiralis TaxID=68182 RepID=A0A561SGR4_9ACTN|nr:hypothetical protein [Streptomyces capillispiralis]TWF74059.1 hypothetical protein FHX78_1291 [Streptomyces capillispiralis]